MAEPFVWAIALLPVVAVALAVNIYWGGMILMRRDWSSGRLWMIVGVIWLIAVAIDFAHH